MCALSTDRFESTSYKEGTAQRTVEAQKVIKNTYVRLIVHLSLHFCVVPLFSYTLCSQPTQYVSGFVCVRVTPLSLSETTLSAAPRALLVYWYRPAHSWTLTMFSTTRHDDPVSKGREHRRKCLDRIAILGTHGGALPSEKKFLKEVEEGKSTPLTKDLSFMQTAQFVEDLVTNYSGESRNLLLKAYKDKQINLLRR